MKKLVFGSLNIDRKYTVNHLVKAGETVSAEKYEVLCGGKGFNQAVAMANAGADICFAGAVGYDGDMLIKAMEQAGINTGFLLRTDCPNGHAVIQVDSDGQNSIIVSDGSNGKIEREYIDKTLARFEKGDFVLLQNEISNVDYIIRQAHKKGMVIAFNVSPLNKNADACDLSLVDYILINEVEGEYLTGEAEPKKIIENLHRNYPGMNIVLTLGDKGSVFCGKDGVVFTCEAYKTNVVDTTSAGDTYAGFFLSEITNGTTVKRSMQIASVAAGICVSRHGSSNSIPSYDEVRRYNQPTTIFS